MVYTFPNQRSFFFFFHSNKNSNTSGSLVSRCSRERQRGSEKILTYLRLLTFCILFVINTHFIVRPRAQSEQGETASKRTQKMPSDGDFKDPPVDKGKCPLRAWRRPPAGTAPDSEGKARRMLSASPRRWAPPHAPDLGLSFPFCKTGPDDLKAALQHPRRGAPLPRRTTGTPVGTRAVRIHTAAPAGGTSPRPPHLSVSDYRVAGWTSAKWQLLLRFL